MLIWSGRHRRLLNQPIDRAGGLANSVALLALDINDYAYRSDFGDDIDAYLTAFLANVHWPRVADRYAAATAGIEEPEPPKTEITCEEVHDRLAAGESMYLLDVRLKDDMARATDRIAAVDWRDPERLDDWADSLPRDRPAGGVLYVRFLGQPGYRRRAARARSGRPHLGRWDRCLAGRRRADRIDRTTIRLIETVAENTVLWLAAGAERADERRHGVVWEYTLQAVAIV